MSRRALWMIAGGFGVGLLLFFLLWLDIRDSGDFYRAEGKTETADGQVFEPLPSPMSDGERSASGLSEATEHAPPAQARQTAVQPEPPRTTETPPARGPSTPERTTASQGRDSLPVAVSRPAPTYPPEAVRKGESGKVVVRIDVDADGAVVDAEVARSSRSRALDRAALQAVRRWRFRPAQRDGQPVAGTVEIPIDFTLDGR